MRRWLGIMKKVKIFEVNTGWKSEGTDSVTNPFLSGSILKKAAFMIKESLLMIKASPFDDRGITC